MSILAVLIGLHGFSEEAVKLREKNYRMVSEVFVAENKVYAGLNLSVHIFKNYATAQLELSDICLIFSTIVVE